MSVDLREDPLGILGYSSDDGADGMCVCACVLDGKRSSFEQ